MISRSSPSARSNGTWIAPQGSSAAPSLPESRDRVMAAGLRERPVAAEELGAVAGQRARQIVDVEERDPARRIRVL